MKHWPRYYTLVGKVAVQAPDAETWAKCFESADRIVAQTRIGGCSISTVFLGINHQFGDGPPLLFETMIFRGGDGDDTWRCETWAEAEEQHKKAVELVRKEIKEKVND